MTTERDKLLDKIRALLSKTTENGCTEAEALASLDKARAMMDAYEITEQDLELTKGEGAVFRREPKGTKDPHRVKWHLAASVAAFCDCRAWRDGSTKGLVFCGLQSDAQFATWLLDHLTNFVLGELTRHLVGNLAPQSDRRLVINGFVLGCTSRISMRLGELTRKAKEATAAAPSASNARALVVVKSQAIKELMAREGIKLRSGGSSRRQIDGNAYQAGKAAGDRASFGRPVSGKASVLRLT